jgi:hypothetical protein
MSKDSDRGGGWRRSAVLLRSGVAVSAIAAVALLAAGCGGGSPTGAGTTSYYQKAVAYSQCMRAHGEPGFPDPTSNGSFLINGKSDHLTGGSVMAKAQKTCQHLLPPSKPLTAAQQRQITNQALKFVACMRAHGLPGMPDPVVNSQGVEISLSGTGVKPNSPVLQAAQRACQRLTPGLPGGPRAQKG